MKRLVFLFTLFAISVASRLDLSGKVITFPMESNTAHARLTPALNKDFSSLTVCLRFFTDLSRGQSLFSLSLQRDDNAFLLWKGNQGTYRVHINSKSEFVDFFGIEAELNVWNTVCVTWDSGTGVTQLWVNGKPSSRKGLRRGTSITGTPVIIVGQEQDSYGGGFDEKQSFVGMLTDVHMWDSVLPPNKIQYYTFNLHFPPGNVLNWGSLEFSQNGYVLIENQEITRVAGSPNTHR